MEAESTPETSKPRRYNAPGGPPGNQKALKHGIHGLKRMRKSGKLDKRTSFGRYISHLGGDQLSRMELAIIEDTVWTDFYTSAYDLYLSSLKSVIRKGRPHPIVDARTRLASHRRENLKTLGLKRAVKTLSLQDILAKDEDKPEQPANGTRGDEGGQMNVNGEFLPCRRYCKCGKYSNDLGSEGHPLLFSSAGL